MSDSTVAEFKGWRAYLWPVHRHELPKLLPMLLILFFLTFNYNILRTMKDTLVVATGKSVGAEVLPFIKVWVMFPGSVLLTYIFTRLSNRLNRETVFYLMMGIFLGYFALFVFILYPNSGAIHPHGFADHLASLLPTGMKGFVAMIRNWSFTTFYVMSELWGNIVLFLLFWAFANQITQLGEAKRFYALLGIATNVSGILAGEFAIQVSQLEFQSFIPYGAQAWDQQVMILVLTIIASGLLSMYLYRWMHIHVLVDDSAEADPKREGQIKGKMSMRDNFSYLFKSKYLLGIAVITLSYNIIINLVEVLWKDQVYALYPNPSDYNLYMNRVMMSIGVITTVASTVLTGNIIRVFGWTKTAMMAPIVLLVTSIAFFSAFFSKDLLAYYPWLTFGFSPVMVVATLGTIQNCLSRGAKYTVYDATREMAFVPLSQESKLKGKAAIDGVCSRLGKSGGSVIHQSLLIAFSSFTASAPYVAFFLGTVLVIWIGAVRVMGREFSLLATGKEEATSAPAKMKPVLGAVS